MTMLGSRFSALCSLSKANWLVMNSTRTSSTKIKRKDKDLKSAAQLIDVLQDGTIASPLSASLESKQNTPVVYEDCRIDVVETIPTGLEDLACASSISTFDAWNSMLKNAEKSVDIAAFYWTLKDVDGYETSDKGMEIYENIIAAAKRGVKIRIAQHVPSKISKQDESKFLESQGLAEVRSLNFSSFNTGVLHTKMWVVDGKHTYLGSANMDWRSLTEVKELGVLVSNSTSLANDMSKIFSTYWHVGAANRRPPRYWPKEFETDINSQKPLGLQCPLNNTPLSSNINESDEQSITSDLTKARVFLSNCPAELNPKGREHDLNAVLDAIKNANRYIRISVMEYLPATCFLRPNTRNIYWPVIDNALRSAAFRGVNVEMMISDWKYTKKQVYPHLKSLLQTNNGMKGKFSIKMFYVPSNTKQSRIDHARVNHAKYMVTDKMAYIGTSNWSGDYFITTAGIGMSIQSVDSPALVEKFNQVFERDWNSPYAGPLNVEDNIYVQERIESIVEVVI